MMVGIIFAIACFLAVRVDGQVTTEQVLFQIQDNGASLMDIQNNMIPLIVRQLSGINDGVNSFQHSMVIIQASDGRLNDKVDVITSKTSDTNTKVTNIQTRVNDIATKFNSIRSTVDSINSKPDGIKETSDRVNDHANNIRTSSEEISKNVVEVDEKWKSIATSIDPVLFNATVTSRKLDVLLNVMTNIRSQLSRLDNQIN